MDNPKYPKPSYATDDPLLEEAAIPGPPSLLPLSSVPIVPEAYLGSLPLKRKPIQGVAKAGVQL